MQRSQGPLVSPNPMPTSRNKNISLLDNYSSFDLWKLHLKTILLYMDFLSSFKGRFLNPSFKYVFFAFEIQRFTLEKWTQLERMYKKKHNFQGERKNKW